MTRKSSKSKGLDLKLRTEITNQFIEKILSLPGSVKTDYLKEVFLSKFVSSETAPPDVRRQAAIRKWLSVERDNEATNERLLMTPDCYNILSGVSFGRFTGLCRELIRDMIGDTPPIEALIGSFSGGASTSRSRTSSYPASKYLGQAHVTPRCLEWFALLLDELPGWLGFTDDLKPKIVRGNVLFTVPKNTDIDRVACKEPDLNMFIQKGVGSFLRKALRRAGINLNDQSVNRSLARLGAKTGELATLDLSSASDSVTEGLVSLLLPECWYTLLDASRCQVTIIDGEEHRNSMFSSMGNGFTFELETLLFYVLARTVARVRGISGVISVFGDDIICPVGIYDDLVSVLDYFGFSVNPDKSFSSGPFRESCGGHYWNEDDITPFYLEGPIDNLLDLIHTANSLRNWASKKDSLPGVEILDLDVEPIWFWLKSFVPQDLWGGGDTSFKYQLVSDDTPRCKISEETRKRGVGTGGYFHWLNATWTRTLPGDGIATSERTVTLGSHRLRKVRDKRKPRLQSYFLSEIG